MLKDASGKWYGIATNTNAWNNHGWWWYFCHHHPSLSPARGERKPGGSRAHWAPGYLGWSMMPSYWMLNLSQAWTHSQLRVCEKTVATANHAGIKVDQGYSPSNRWIHIDPRPRMAISVVHPIRCCRASAVPRNTWSATLRIMISPASGFRWGPTGRDEDLPGVVARCPTGTPTVMTLVRAGAGKHEEWQNSEKWCCKHGGFRLLTSQHLRFPALNSGELNELEVALVGGEVDIWITTVLRPQAMNSCANAHMCPAAATSCNEWGHWNLLGH